MTRQALSSLRFPLTALALACAASWPALAADAPAPADVAKPAKSEDKEAIQVQGKSNMETAIRRNQPASKIIVGREELDRYGDSSVGDVLKRLPGVTMGGPPGRGSGIRMRGLSEGYTQILINGEPMARGFSLESLSPDAIERIEVMRAPVAEHSARAIAGTINIILREDFVAKAQPAQARMALAVEDGRVQPRVDVQWGGKTDELNYTLGGGYNHNNRANSSTATEQGTGHNGLPYDEARSNNSKSSGYNVNFTPRLTWRFSPGNTLSFQTFLMRGENDGHSESSVVRLAGEPANYALAVTDSSSRMDMARGFGNWKQTFEGGSTLEGRFGFNANESRSQSHRDEYDAFGVGTRNTDDTSKVHDKGFTTGGKWSQSLGEDHSIALGWDLDLSRREETRVKLIDGQPYVTDAGDDLTARTSRYALFGQDEWNMGPQWSAYAGLRWEGIKTQSTDAMGDTNNTSSVWSPMLHAIYRIPGSTKDQLRGSLTRSYKSPNIRDLISRPVLSQDDNTRSDPDRAGNPNLKPELAWGLDFAYEHYFAQGGLVSATTFVRKIDNLIRRDTMLEDVEGEQRWVSRPRNLGEATSYGVELEAKFRLAELFDDAPPLDLRANYSRYWSQVKDVPGPNNRLDEQVPELFNLGLDYKFTGTPLTVGTNINLVPSYTVRTTETEWKEVDAKRQIDIYGLYRFSPSMQLRVTASNLLHQDYVTSVRQTGAGATQSSTRTPTYTQVTAMLEVKF
ncbi:TonB-dependent receptor [Chitinimonas sp.]|uniref:TonB-dependent receptor plug domain-containing protein n=1 Tax=Chitinimonas sp. TaxID=1934313 RepID=UPI002F9422C9